MNGPEFFRTGIGRKFYEVDVPRIAESLGRIADALERISKPDPKMLNLYSVITQAHGMVVIEAHSLAEAQSDACNRFGVTNPIAVRPCTDARRPTGFAGFRGMSGKDD